MADDGFCLPDDVLVQILLLLTPASSRRPLRLVCKGWRDLIDECTPPEEKLPAKILVFTNGSRSSSAIVFDDKNGRRTHKWTYTGSSDQGSVYMVGTCNGLLCLHEHSSYGGISFSAVKVTNPVTGETLALPPVPTPWSWSQFVKPPGNYSFGFHPETKRHKVVYIPRGQRRSAAALQVFTLGDEAWREVQLPTPGACYDLLCEAVSVDGSTYWLPASSGRVMALDLKDERVTSLDVPPVAMMGPSPIMSAARWRLTKVHARIGVVVSVGVPSWTRVEVWVLDGGGDQPQWSQKYSVVDMMWSSWIMAPQLTHGDYILSASREPWRGRGTQLYQHKVGDLTDGDGVIGRLRLPKEAQFIMTEQERGANSRLLPASRL